MANITHDNVKLSILIPCYNVSNYIDECLSSIIDQLTDECEVIIYDDGSKDDTVEKIKNHKLLSLDRVRFLSAQQNNGISYVRNYLLEQACGHYIWFIDSDDKILDCAIIQLLSYIDQYNPDIVFFDYNAWYPNITKSMIRKGFHRSSFIGRPGFYGNVCDGFLLNATLKSTRLHPWSKVYRRSLFKPGTDFPVGKVFEDVTVIPLLSAYAQTAYYLDKPLVAYRTRSGSILSSLNFEKEIDSLAAIHEMKIRHEKYIGPMSKKSHLVTTYFATCQLRRIIKVLAKHPNKEKRAVLIACCLSEFEKIHGKDIFYVLYACWREGDFTHSVHCLKRLMQAYFICGFKKQKSLSAPGKAG
ncbi:glycosyltransferase family 2 protein [Paenochrobactrum sp. BZR 588]|uniref:glycosyltransferase family 2 protein n=1 Tax=unclassified Paenochrobactrum TaxID=2639760 RepID=UPI0038551B3D